MTGNLNAPRESDITQRNAAGQCWHATVVHYHARCLMVCDATNERLFSIIHQLYDQDITVAPHRIA